MVNKEPVMFLYPTEIVDEFEKATGVKLPPDAMQWVRLFDSVVSAFDAKGREDRRAGRPAASWECFLAWAVKNVGQQDAEPVAELVQDYYIDAYNSGLNREERAWK